MKLYSKWDEPYRLARISKSGVSGDQEDFKTGKIIGHYAFESLKVFMLREERVAAETEGWTAFETGVNMLVYCSLSLGQRGW